MEVGGVVSLARHGAVWDWDWGLDRIDLHAHAAAGI